MSATKEQVQIDLVYKCVTHRVMFEGSPFLVCYEYDECGGGDTTVSDEMGNHIDDDAVIDAILDLMEGKDNG